MRLSLPAATRYARVARLTAAALATRAGFAYQEVEELRSTLGSLLDGLFDDHDGVVEIRFELDTGSVSIFASRSNGGTSVTLERRAAA